MEDLKEIATFISGLPNLAVWVLAGFLAYKLALVGSVYGTIRFALHLWHDYKTRPPAPAQMLLGVKAIDAETADALRTLLSRVSNGSYVHMTDVRTLSRAIDHVEATRSGQKSPSSP